MKARTLCTAALTAVVAATFVGGFTAAAEGENQVTTKPAHTLSGKGEVEFEEDTDTNNKLDPEDPKKPGEPNDKDTNDNTVGGPITIDRVTVLDFGKQKVSTKNERYEARAIEVDKSDSAEGDKKYEERGPWVQWTDKRAGADHRYAIKAQITTPFTFTPAKAEKSGESKILAGASITYTNGVLNSDQTDQKLWPKGNPEPRTTLATGGEKVLMFDNTKSQNGEGLGTYTMEYGQSATFDPESINRDGVTTPSTGVGQASKSVFLDVPAQSIEKGSYVAAITWSIELVPEA